MKRLGVGLAVLFTIVLVVPATIVLFSGDKAPPTNEPAPQITLPISLDKQIPISVYRTESKRVEVHPIEEYIVGVVAGEMPANFELEALKAQALAARTYIIRRIVAKDYADVPGGAYVTDTVKNQVFLDDRQRRANWGKDYQAKLKKVREAVLQTEGKILTYQGNPINATFFSASNGYTQDSEDYWGDVIPYLRRVKVPWDKNSPKYKLEMTIPLNDAEKRLGVQISQAASTSSNWYKVIDRSASDHIKKVEIGGKTFTGKEVREKLGLSSTAFDWKVEDGGLRVTTYGSGHDVGMSQWGAQGMALEGKKAEDIVKYFYKDVQIEDYHKWIGSKK
jgi:stage II sporulation protein D